MDNYNITGKDNPVGTTFLGVTLDPEGIPVGIFKSLASMIGLSHPKTKLCPFCEETIEGLRKDRNYRDPNHMLSDISLKVRGLKRDVDSLQKLLGVIDMRREECIERKERIGRL